MKESEGATFGGVLTEGEDGKTFYEVRLRMQEHSHDLVIAADGSPVEEERSDGTGVVGTFH